MLPMYDIDEDGEGGSRVKQRFATVNKIKGVRWNKNNENVDFIMHDLNEPAGMVVRGPTRLGLRAQKMINARPSSLPRAEFMRYAKLGKMKYPSNIMHLLASKIKRHKRGLMLGAAVVGATAAVVGGTLGRIYGTKYEKKKDNNNNIMQNDS